MSRTSSEHQKMLRQRIAERAKSRRKLDLSSLPREDRERVLRALKKRDVTFSRKFAAEDIQQWEDQAKSKKESVREWVERNLNAAVAADK
jgi:hypothetical protein